jgi:mandelate racemase
VTESVLVLTDVITSDGSIGHSIVFTYSAALLRPTAQLIENRGATVRVSAVLPVHVFDGLTASRHARFNGTAIAALDMAIWDALARTWNVPLATALGRM